MPTSLPSSAPYKVAEQLFSTEIASLTRVLAQMETTFDDAVELLRTCSGKVAVTGVGKSGIVGHKIAATFAATGTRAVYIHAAEALHGDLGAIASDDVVVLVSNSGRTPELLQMLPSLRRIGPRLLGLLGSPDSPIGGACDLTLNLSVQNEGCPLGLAPMASATVAAVAGDALACALMSISRFSRERFAVYHPGGALGRRLLIRVSDIMQTGNGVPCMPLDASLRQIIGAMNNSVFGGVMITSNDVLKGVFTDGDLRRLVLQGISLDAAVKNVMNPAPITVDVEATVGDVLDAMERRGRKVYFLPVVDSHQCVLGVVRMHDIVGP